MDDEPESRSGSKPTQVPSWVMLGFALGALFVLLLPKASPPPEPLVTKDAPAPQSAPSVPLLMGIEGMFEQWGRYAVWNGDRTEVAAWNTGTKDYTDFFEVKRDGGEYYFRTIPSLTQPLLTHGVPEGSLLHFTESAEQRAQWLRDVANQNKKAINEATINILSGGRRPPPPLIPPPEIPKVVLPPADGK